MKDGLIFKASILAASLVLFLIAGQLFNSGDTAAAWLMIGTGALGLIPAMLE
jgi:hypothetical protein